MKKIGAAIAAGAVLAFSASAYAQVTIDLTPEVRTEFHGFIMKEKVKPVTVEKEIVVGGEVPAAVELQPVPDVIVTRTPTLRGHRYFVAGNRIYVVHPESRQVVTVID